MKYNILNFLNEDIWLIQEQKFPPWKAFLIKTVKVCLLSAQGFKRDLCPLRASALTLYTVLAVVPVVAMLFGIAKGFGFEKMLTARLLEQAPQQDELVLKLIGFAQNLLDSTKGGIVAGIGVIVLFWIVINLISNIEESFNHIWKVDKGRSVSRKYSDYLSLMFLAPVILIASSSITVLLSTKITWLVKVMELGEMGTWLVLKTLELLPILLMVGLFSFTLIFMPNHKVVSRAGVCAGIITGSMYFFTQWLYLSLQVGVSSYNTIYGSFAAIPLFFIWLQTTWFIVLFGCEIAFFLQNYENYRNNNRFSNISLSLQKIIALQITHLIVKNFTYSSKPLTADEIASHLITPTSVINKILIKLKLSNILIEVKTEGEEDETYLPAVDTNLLTIAFVIEALEQFGQNQLFEINQERQFADTINHFKELIKNSENNRLLRDI